VVNEDAKNIIRIEWTNRGNGYTIEVMEARDAAHIELFGERPADVREHGTRSTIRLWRRLLRSSCCSAK
jgi:hypothetical protein